MSHFAVMVIGADPATQLAPYHEFESTGIDDEYVVDEDITDEVLRDFRKNIRCDTIEEYCKHYCGMALLTSYEAFGEEHKYGYFMLKENGELEKVINRTNPNSKWDWYVLGGRWSGYFKLKTGSTGEIGEHDSPVKAGYADAALKKDIDFAGMRQEARENAARKYDQIKAILDKYPGWKTYEQLEKQFKENIQEARESYWKQPAVKALEDAGYRFFFGEILNECNLPREEYLKKAENSAITTYAFVKNSEWVGKGDMGWWGISTNDKDEAVWNAEFNKMLDALPDDTLLSVYDCHI